MAGERCYQYNLDKITIVYVENDCEFAETSFAPPTGSGSGGGLFLNSINDLEVGGGSSIQISDPFIVPTLPDGTVVNFEEDMARSLAFKLNLTNQDQIDHLIANFRTVIDINAFLESNDTVEGEIASKITIEALNLGLLNNTTSEISVSFYNTNLQQFCCITFPTIGLAYAEYVANEMFILKVQNPEWSKTRLYLEANKAAAQLILDLGGLVPVVGEVCDVDNGIIYTIDGDTVNATLSFSAAIPIASWFSTGGKLLYKTASNISSKQVLQWVVKTNGFIHFGRSSQLRKVLGISNSANHAHHIIPWALRENPLVQQAAKAGDAFHMNDVVNGFEIVGWLNTTHPAYNDAVEEMLNTAFDAAPNMTPNQAREVLQDIIDNLDTLIKINPSIKLQDLF